jgi:hypothetical protein
MDEGIAAIESLPAIVGKLIKLRIEDLGK